MKSMTALYTLLGKFYAFTLEKPLYTTELQRITTVFHMTNLSYSLNIEKADLIK